MQQRASLQHSTATSDESLQQRTRRYDSSKKKHLPLAAQEGLVQTPQHRDRSRARWPLREDCRDNAWRVTVTRGQAGRVICHPPYSEWLHVFTHSRLCRPAAPGQREPGGCVGVFIFSRVLVSGLRRPRSQTQRKASRCTVTSEGESNPRPSVSVVPF